VIKYYKLPVYLLLYCLALQGSVYGQVTTTILHSFVGGSGDGSGPFNEGLVEGTDGNFYGATQQGGPGGTNGGTVYMMTPSGTITILHDFPAFTSDGVNPYGNLIFAYGNLCGTTEQGGTHNRGTVFSITTTGTLTVAHNFGDGTVLNDGINPQAGLILGTDGSLYGTTDEGGADGDGTVFKITSTGTMSIIHSFQDGTVANDGNGPKAALLQASDGNLYGTTFRGGASDEGTILKLHPA